MNLISLIVSDLDTSGFQTPKGMTEEEMMDLMKILYKTVYIIIYFYIFYIIL